MRDRLTFIRSRSWHCRYRSQFSRQPIGGMVGSVVQPDLDRLLIGLRPAPTVSRTRTGGGWAEWWRSRVNFRLMPTHGVGESKYDHFQSKFGWDSADVDPLEFIDSFDSSSVSDDHERWRHSAHRCARFRCIRDLRYIYIYQIFK